MTNDVVVMVNTLGVMLIVPEKVCDCCGLVPESVTLTVIGNTPPGPLGSAPAIAPVAAFSDNPEGSDPVTMLQV